MILNIFGLDVDVDLVKLAKFIEDAVAISNEANRERDLKEAQDVRDKINILLDMEKDMTEERRKQLYRRLKKQGKIK